MNRPPQSTSRYSARASAAGLLICALILPFTLTGCQSTGRIVVSKPITKPRLPEPDVDTLRELATTRPMTNWFYQVGSTNDSTALGRAFDLDNHPIAIPPELITPPGTVSLIVTGETVPCSRETKGVRFYLVNQTPRVANFDAAIARLFCVMQAKNQQGQWQDIEVSIFPKCGNAYHQVFLPPGKAWKLAGPLYSGSFKTKLRFALSGPSPRSPNPNKLTYDESTQMIQVESDDQYCAELRALEAFPKKYIYSNEFDGSIDPGQFVIHSPHSQ